MGKEVEEEEEEEEEKNCYFMRKQRNGETRYRGYLHAIC